MENYVIAELEIIALATGDPIDTSNVIDRDENELPIDPTSGANGRTLTA